jgi:hypothetical protein
MKHLFKSLAEFQQEVPTIHKATQGYGYTYADLPKIFEVINPLLKKHGLGFTQLINGTELITIVFHVESGETIESKTAIPQNVALKGMNDFQVLGSAITYLRRYALSSILGIVSDKDTDAGGEQIKVEAKKPAINESRFKKALQSIADGNYSVDELTSTFGLTDEQLKTLAI